MNTVSIKDVSIRPSFFRSLMDMVASRMIPFQWEALNDHVPDAAPSYCIRNLRAVIGRAGKGALPFEKIPAAVREVTHDYIPTDDTAADRLNEALTVMAYAYTAGQYKQEADRRFQLMKEEHHENPHR